MLWSEKTFYDEIKSMHLVFFFFNWFLSNAAYFSGSVHIINGSIFFKWANVHASSDDNTDKSNAQTFSYLLSLFADKITIWQKSQLKPKSI